MGCTNYDLKKSSTLDPTLIELDPRETLSRLLEFSSVGLALLTLDGKFVYVNPALTTTLGYSKEELLDTNFQAIIHPSETETESFPLNQLLTGEINAYQSKKYCLHKQGHILEVRLSYTLLRDQQCMPNYILSELVAITRHTTLEEKPQEIDYQQIEMQLRESEERYRLVAETATDAILITDEDNLIIFANQAVEDIFGYAATELTGQSLLVLMPIYQRYLFAESMKKYLASGRRTLGWKGLRLKGLHRNGQEVPVEVSTGEYQRGGKWFFNAIIRDITQRVIDEQNLKLLESAVLHAEEAVIITDAGLDDPGPSIKYVNPAFTKITGYTAEEVLGKSPAILQGPKTEHPILDELRQNLATSPIFHGETVNYRKDGAELIMEGQIAPIRSEGGEITHFVAIQRDVTERRKAEVRLRESEERYRYISEKLEMLVMERTAALNEANQQLMIEVNERKRAEASLIESNRRITSILDSISDGFFALDHNVQLTYFNQQALHFLQKSHEELLNEGLVEEFLRADHLATMNREKGYITIEKFYRTLNSWFELHIYPYEDGLSVYFRDITERKRAENEIEKALAKERELNELKSRFVTLTSHEFRTPLSAILASAELLEHYHYRWSDEKRNEILRRIQTAALHMNHLLEDILLIGKAEAGRLEFNPALLKPAQFASNLVEELRLGIGQKHTIEFSCQDVERIMFLDEKLLYRIFINLFSNAFKYSNPGTTVRLELTFEDDRAIFMVSDRGIGIPAEDQEHLFESFHRARNVGTVSGTGLGLVIVKHSVETHGGTINITSQVGLGTTITVSVPSAAMSK
jgi:PAS domain S-box-containing protein